MEGWAGSYVSAIFPLQKDIFLYWSWLCEVTLRVHNPTPMIFENPDRLAGPQTQDNGLNERPMQQESTIWILF